MKKENTTVVEDITLASTAPNEMRGKYHCADAT